MLDPDSSAGPSCPRIGSFNCNGLGNASKRNLVLNWLKAKPEEIIFLQENHSTPLTEAMWRNSWEGEVIFNHGTSSSNGVAILIKRNIANFKVVNHRNVGEGRAILLEVEYNSLKLCLVNVYCPNNDDVEFLQNLFHETLGRARDDEVIMAGDWNTVLQNELDKIGGAATHANKKCQQFLNNIINNYGFSDIFRLNRGNDRIYTHFNKQH